MSQVANALRLASTVACGVVFVAFMLWASDETKVAATQQAEAAATDPAPSTGPTGAPVAAAPEPEHGGLRGAIEDANETLIAPFDEVTASSNEWVQHGVPMLLALLVYGLLGRVVIAYLPRG